MQHTMTYKVPPLQHNRIPAQNNYVSDYSSYKQVSVFTGPIPTPSGQIQLPRSVVSSKEHGIGSC